MRSLLKPFLFIALTTFYLLLAPPVFASPEFLTSFTSNYLIDDQGTANVTHTITLENRHSNIYATDYALQVGSTQLKDITSITSSGSPIPFTTTQTDNATAIKLNFPTQVVGKGKQLNFTINYQNPDTTNITGQVLEVNIPQVSNLDQIESYLVNLSVPEKFGPPSQVTPKQYSLQTLAGTNQLSFAKQNLGEYGITALFGDHQVFNFTLNYHLLNTSSSQGLSQIALPPDTPYQRLHYSLIDPKPDDITADSDGNWLATYKLKPQQKIDVVAQGNAVLYLTPTVPVTNYNTQDLSTYLQPQPFWPTTDPDIIALATQLSTAENIYSYLVDNFSYNYSRLDSTTSRLGAKQAIDNPTNAICQEFTDAFVTLARAAGIPARQHNGFAYTENSRLRPLSLIQDVLHAWPEYYDQDKQVWIPVDPTWGNTTGGIDYFNSLDLNHFTFVIHGSDSQSPYPAGYYKLQDSLSKDILVDFGDNLPEPTLNLDFSLSLLPTSLFGFSSPANLTITNSGPTALYNLALNLSTSNFTLKSSPQITLDHHLPFTTQSHRLKLTPRQPFQSQPGTLTITANSQTFTHEINQVFNQENAPQAAIAAMAISATILAAVAWRLLVHFSSKGRSLRW